MPPAKRSRTQEPSRAESAHSTSSVADEDLTAAAAGPTGSSAVAAGADGAAAATAHDAPTGGATTGSDSTLGPDEELEVDAEGVVWIRNRYTDAYRLKDDPEAAEKRDRCAAEAAERDIGAAVKQAREALGGTNASAVGDGDRPFYARPAAAEQSSLIPTKRLAERRRRLEEDKARDGQNWQQFSRQEDSFRSGED
eukprot:COSAG06_NODE_4836_length_3919_cov_4.689005_4_plen_196_part_00